MSDFSATSRVLDMKNVIRRSRGQVIGAVLVMGLGAVPCVAHAQQPVMAAPFAAPRGGVPELVTDRPDFTESSEIIERGSLQFESGVNYESDAESGLLSRAFSAPTALLRIGLGHRAELRVGADGLVTTSVAGSRVSGYSDVELGAKIRLFDQRSLGVDLAVLPMVSLPTGSDDFSSGAADPTVKITWARDLPAGFGLSGNVNASSISEDGRRFHQQALSASLGHDLVAGFGSYVEVYGFSKMSPDDGRGVTVDGGVSHLIGGDIQFDIETGRGLTAAAPDWFIGVGIAIRGRVRR